MMAIKAPAAAEALSEPSNGDQCVNNHLHRMLRNAGFLPTPVDILPAGSLDLSGTAHLDVGERRGPPHDGHHSASSSRGIKRALQGRPVRQQSPAQDGRPTSNSTTGLHASKYARLHQQQHVAPRKHHDSVHPAPCRNTGSHPAPVIACNPRNHDASATQQSSSTKRTLLSMNEYSSSAATAAATAAG